MKSRDFAFWLQGFFEITNPTEINQLQTELIKKHLNLVFVHEIDPSMGDQDEQDKLNEIHNEPPVALGRPDHGSEAWGIATFGAKPAPHYVLNSLHGWYDPKEAVPRC